MHVHDDPLLFRLDSDPVVEYGNIFTFRIGQALITVRVVFHDEDSGADVAITNMTTHPEKERGNGYGSRVLQFLITQFKKYDLSTIVAVQVTNEQSERFWLRNGFQKMHNETNDFSLS